MTTNHNVNGTTSSASQLYCDSVRSNHGSCIQSNPVSGQASASAHAATLFGNQASAYPSLWSHHATINGHHASSDNDWHVLRNGSDTQKFSGHSVDMPPSGSFSSRTSLQPYWQQLTGNVTSFQAPSASSNYGHHGYTASGGLIASGSMFGSTSAGNGLWGGDYGSSMRRCNASDLRPRPYSGEVLNSLDMDVQEELPSNDDLEQFAKQFKQRRIKLGKL